MSVVFFGNREGSLRISYRYVGFKYHLNDSIQVCSAPLGVMNQLLRLFKDTFYLLQRRPYGIIGSILLPVGPVVKPAVQSSELYLII